MSSEHKEIAIVGAGVAGLYCAWRLLSTDFAPERLGLFEASARIGGRILTCAPPSAPSLKVDLGASYLNARHERALSLVAGFGLGTQPAGMTERKGLVHLRATTRTNAQTRHAWLRKPFPYAVSRRDQRRGAQRLLRKAMDGLSSGTVDLDKATLPDALAQVLSAEELSFLAQTMGYSFIEAPLHARATLDWLGRELFGGPGGFLTLTDGMSALVGALAERIAEKGTEVQTGHCLRAIAIGQSGTPSTLHFGLDEGTSRTITADRVVLAMPREAIGNIGGLAEREAIRQLLSDVAGWPITTGALVYPDRWWMPLGFRAGRTITDLPIGQLFHIGARGEHDGHAAVKFYAEGKRAEHWRAMLEPGACGAWGGAMTPMTAEVHRQVAQVFEPRLGRPLPMPIDAIVQDWGAQPYGAAFHLWAHGSDPQRSMESALQPMPDASIHLCGETWAARHGWVEGALETVDSLIERHLR